MKFISMCLKAGAGADAGLTHKVRIYRKCLNFLPWTVLQFAPFMYEQVRRGIQLICYLAASLKFISFATFVVAVDGVGFNFNRHFSSSVYVVVDTKLFDPFLSMCDQS
jgi:hypothetical protein